MELCWEVLVGENESKFRPSWSIASLHGVWGPQFFCLGACLSCGLETALQSSVCSLEHQVPCWSRQRPGGWSPGGVGVPHSAGSLERGSQALLASSGTSGLGVCCQLALQQESEGHQVPVSKTAEQPKSPDHVPRRRRFLPCRLSAPLSSHSPRSSQRALELPAPPPERPCGPTPSLRAVSFKLHRVFSSSP